MIRPALLGRLALIVNLRAFIILAPTIGGSEFFDKVGCLEEKRNLCEMTYEVKYLKDQNREWTLINGDFNIWLFVCLCVLDAPSQSRWISDV